MKVTVKQFYSNGKVKTIEQIKQEVLKKSGLNSLLNFSSNPSIKEIERGEKISFKIDNEYDCNLREQTYIV